MPLDSDLARRYAAAFAIYGSGGDSLLVWTKERIAARSDMLREDAMVFLLTSFDHMVIRPICGYLPAPGDELGRPLPAFRPEGDVRRMVADALEIILDEAGRASADGKISANAVIRAMSAKSEAISQAVSWWREG